MEPLWELDRLERFLAWLREIGCDCVPDVRFADDGRYQNMVATHEESCAAVQSVRRAFTIGELDG